MKRPQMAAMQQQYRAMWMMNPSWGYAPAGMMAGGTPASMSGGGPPGVMKRPPGAESGAAPNPQGAASEKKGLALLGEAKHGKTQQTNESLEKQMMASYMMAKGEPPVAPQTPQLPQPQAPTERQLMIAAVREQLMKATVRKGPPQHACIPLRHSTFSALNLEVGARPRQSVVNRRQSLAELKESVHEMRRAQASKQTSAEGPAEASPVAVENPSDVDDSSLTVHSTLELEHTRTPSTAESVEGTPTGSGEGTPKGSEHAAHSEVYGKANAHEHVSDGQFARSTLLLFRSPVEAVPPELQTLSVVPDPACEPSDRALFGTGLNRSAPKLTPKARSQDATWVPKVAISENAWKPSGSTTFSRPARLRRDLKSLLNKVCPENVMIIVERMANTEIGTLEELELLISLIFEKALAEPHYCETYADMTFSLKDWMPEFHSEALGKAVTFRAALINACQHEFESLSSTLALDAEEVDLQRKKRKDRVLANMKFIGQLFLREMLSAKIIGSVIQDLALCHQPEEVPEEPMVECICELLTNIGYTLELSPIGANALAAVCLRLKDLQGRRIDGSQLLYSKRIQFAIQDLLDIRAASWTKRTFKASAKTKEEIRFQQEKDIAAQARG